MTHWYNSEPLGFPFHNTTSKSLIRNFIWKPWVACAWGQKVSTCIFFLAMQWKKFSIHLETDGSFRLPVSKLNNRFFLQKNALVQETFFSTYLKKSILSKHIFILVKKTGHCLSKYKLHTNYWGQVFKQVSFITVTRKFSVSSNEQKGRLKTKFYSIGYYCTRNLSFIHNKTLDLALSFLVTSFRQSRATFEPNQRPYWNRIDCGNGKNWLISRKDAKKKSQFVFYQSTFCTTSGALVIYKKIGKARSFVAHTLIWQRRRKMKKGARRWQMGAP